MFIEGGDYDPTVGSHGDVECTGVETDAPRVHPGELDDPRHAAGEVVARDQPQRIVPRLLDGSHIGDDESAIRTVSEINQLDLETVAEKLLALRAGP